MWIKIRGVFLVTLETRIRIKSIGRGSPKVLKFFKMLKLWGAFGPVILPTFCNSLYAGYKTLNNFFQQFINSNGKNYCNY